MQRSAKRWVRGHPANDQLDRAACAKSLVRHNYAGSVQLAKQRSALPSHTSTLVSVDEDVVVR